MATNKDRPFISAKNLLEAQNKITYWILLHMYLVLSLLLVELASNPSSTP
jgi:hypothetical protein